MKKIAVVCAGMMLLAGNVEMRGERPDDVWLYLYTTPAGGNHDGLHWAWSADGERWLSPFPGQRLVSSDYGVWGAEKRMFSPVTVKGDDGLWHVIWGVSEKDGTFAHASSEDLINWKPQNYPMLGVRGNCLEPEAVKAGDEYMVSWLTVEDGDTLVMGAMTPDFMTYSGPKVVPGNVRKDVRVKNEMVARGAEGCVVKISRKELDALIRNAEAQEWQASLYGENAADDKARFAGLKPLKAEARVTGRVRKISPMLMGIFFEDISRAADGGLYAEMVQNRDFEYSGADRLWRDEKWNAKRGWSVEGDGVTFEIDSVEPIHENNRHYGVVATNGNGGKLLNSGFAGVTVKKGEKYDFSIFAKRLEGKGGKFKVSIIDESGKTLCSKVMSAPAGKWGKLKGEMLAGGDAVKGKLGIEPLQEGKIAVDMVSLFPRDTFKGRKNGLRRDLADTIAALQPRFVRFPGGCVAHGDGLGNIYRWKNTIGPLESRVGQRNIWGYHQTAGLGYHEYFEFCEDLGAEPLPVVAAGVPCQNSSCGGAGQQGGIPMGEMDEYVQDVLDLVEYANGDARTTRWGAERARNGHKEPFNLKYIGIGNEDLISDVFKDRFEMIYKAVSEKYPEVTVIGTVGPFHAGSDYDEGWEFATRLGVPMVDEHYYESPSWFIYNQDFYDGYDRKKPHVYLGEYASRGNEVFNALAEAAYLCGVERNGDVVEMTSYAPLLAKEGQTNWNPDMIYFTNSEVKPTVNYRVQRLFGENSGVKAVPMSLSAVEAQPMRVASRLASSAVVSDNGDLIVKLVNILPVEVEAGIGLDDLLDAVGCGADDFGAPLMTVLSGEPTSRNGSLKEQQLNGMAETVNLPAYSLTVLRFPHN